MFAKTHTLNIYGKSGQCQYLPLTMFTFLLEGSELELVDFLFLFLADSFPNMIIFFKFFNYQLVLAICNLTTLDDSSLFSFQEELMNYYLI